MMRVLALCLALWSVGLVAVEVAAAQGRVVVLDFQGRMSRRLRADVVSSISNQGDVTLMPRARAVATAEDRGYDLADAFGRQGLAAELQLRAYVSGHARKKGSRVVLTVRVFDGVDGALLGETRLAGSRRQIRKQVKRQTWRRIRKWINASEAPPPLEDDSFQEIEEEEPPGFNRGRDRDDDDRDDRRSRRRRDRGVGRSTDDSDTEPPDLDSPSDGDHNVFDLAVGMQFITRNYAYNQPLITLAFVDVPLSPVVNVHGHWYPGAHFDDGAAAHIGLDLAYRQWLAGSADRDGTTFNVEASALRIGLRGRIPLGPHELALAAGYASLSYQLADLQDEATGLPGVSYGFLRVGPELRLVFDEVAVELEAAYLLPLKFGNIASDRWFPRTSGHGLDVNLRLAYSLFSVLDVYAAAVFRQVGLTFNPEPGDAGEALGRVAGGAVDRYWGPELGLRLRL